MAGIRGRGLGRRLGVEGGGRVAMLMVVDGERKVTTPRRGWEGRCFGGRRLEPR